MKRNAAHSAPESSGNSSTREDETLPSGSRLTLEGIKSLAEEIKELTTYRETGEEIRSKADEIIREIDGLIKQVTEREAKIYEWASGQ